MIAAAVDPFAAVAAALLDGGRAWLTAPEFAAATGWTEEETLEYLIELVSESLLEAWARPDAEPCFTLSPLGASELGVTLVETSTLELFKWSHESVSIRSRRVTPRQVERMERHDAMLTSVPDRRAVTPDVDVTPGRRGRHERIDDLPRPTVLLWGDGLWAWDEPRQVRHSDRCRDCSVEPPIGKRPGKGRHRLLKPVCRPCGFGLRPRPRLDACPGCRDRPLMRHMYCLRCHRWGWDGVLHRLRRAEAAARAHARPRAKARAC